MTTDRCGPRLCQGHGQCRRRTQAPSRTVSGFDLDSDSDPSDSDVAVLLRVVAGGPGTVPVNASDSDVNSPSRRAALPPGPPLRQLSLGEPPLRPGRHDERCWAPR